MYDFIELDNFIGLFWSYGLKLGFELMGNLLGFFKDFDNLIQVYFWKDMVIQLVLNYIDQFGFSEVMDWNFEIWNELDCYDFDDIKFFVQGFFNYYDVCLEGLLVVSFFLRFGGLGDGCVRLGNIKFFDVFFNYIVNGINFFIGK